MGKLPEGDEWEMIVFDIDGTLLDMDGFQPELIPLIRKKLIKTKDITVDSKSGYSGAGKNLKKKFTHKNLYSSIYAYNVENHKHICEIDQQLYKYTKKKNNVFIYSSSSSYI